MQALLQEALLPVNMVFTILLVFVMLYWLTVLLGLIDISAMDVDLELDADIDTDVDLDADTEVEGNSGGWFSSSLQFFNFGKVPFMVVFSFLTLCMWAFSVLINHYFGHGSWGTAAILFLPNLATGLLLTKVITTPLIPVFKHFDGSALPVEYIGHECTLTLPASNTAMGQAEVLIDDTPLLINVKLDGEDLLARGAKALVVNESPDGRYYIVKALDAE